MKYIYIYTYLHAGPRFTLCILYPLKNMLFEVLTIFVELVVDRKPCDDRFLPSDQAQKKTRIPTLLMPRLRNRDKLRSSIQWLLQTEST